MYGPWEEFETRKPLTNAEDRHFSFRVVTAPVHVKATGTDAGPGPHGIKGVGRRLSVGLVWLGRDDAGTTQLEAVLAMLTERRPYGRAPPFVE